MNFRVCCLLSLFLLVISGSASAVAPNAPTNFAMPKYTYYNSTTEIWRLQWTDNSTDEDGFQIYYGLDGSGPATLYQTVPTALSLANVITTSGSTTVTCASTTSLGAGWTVSGTKIAAGTVVASVTNATTFELSAAATGSGTGQNLAAVSIYKAGSGYTYAMNLGVSTNLGGNYVKWGVVAYKGIPPSELSSNTNVLTFPSWPGTTPLTLTAPSALTVTAAGDSQFHLTYNDNSNSESYFELDYKRHTDTTWLATGLDFGATGSAATGPMTTDVGGYQTRTVNTDIYVPKFLPGTAYDFQIRAVDYGSNASAFTGIVTATSSSTLTGPTNLAATLVGENTFNLTFNNNSNGASGYHFQYRVQGSGAWQEPLSNATPPVPIGYIDQPNFNSVNSSYFVFLAPKTTYEFQVQAYVRNDNVSTGAHISTDPPILFSAYSNTVTATTAFFAPSGLTAATVSESAVNLTWVDNSTTEGGFGIYARISGSGSYTLLAYNSTANATTYAITGLSPGRAYDFQVTSAYQNSAQVILESVPSNSASATTKDGFTSRSYTPITYNQVFSYPLTVSAVSARTSWSVTGLPTGLTFNSSTGIISGTPTVTGLFPCAITATFANGWTTNSTLTLRIVPTPGVPIAAATIAGQTVANGGGVSLTMLDKFADPDSESAVRVITNIGTMDFILYNTATPQTVANFLSYVNNASSSGNYNGAVFHRSVPGFVVQGGGFKVQSAPNAFTTITTAASPPNEPGISNLRGTVAMAKVGTNANSATDQFFVSLADNSANLDSQNGGFTAFARVAGNGMTVADHMATLTKVNAAITLDGTAYPAFDANVNPNNPNPFTACPVISGSTMDTTQVVSITSAAPVAVLSYSVTGNSNPSAVSASINGTNLQINGTAGGQSNVSVAATDLDGNTVTQTFTVTVSQMPAFVSTTPSAAGTVGVSYNYTYSATGYPLPTFGVSSGALPTGLLLSSAGILSGTTTVAGTYSGVVTATNTNGSATQSFSIVVAKGAGSVVLNGLTQTYDGSAKVVTATTSPAGLGVNITYGGSSTAPADFGSYAVVATINDANYVGTQSGTLSITGQPAANWRTQYFTSAQISAGMADNNADPDGDGIKNLEEYALGSNPLTKTPALPLTYDANGLTLTFTRPKGLPGVTYAAESTDTLGRWTPVTLEVVTDGAVQTVRARDTLTSGNPNRRFIRLIFGTP
jgi:cyclophilin family peptidyl-prolyl cis-trans isomerase